MNQNTPDTEGTPRAISWLRPDRMFSEPKRWITASAILTVAAFHLAWVVSGQPYMSPALAVLGGAAVLLAAVALLSRGGKSAVITQRGVLYYFMVLAGVGAVILGLDLIGGGGAALVPWQRPFVGALLLVGGAFVAVSGLLLRPPRPGQSRRVPPMDFASAAVQLAGGEGMVRRSRTGFGAGRVEKLLEACKAAVKTDDLHYVAYLVDGECAFYVDVFTDPALETFFAEDALIEARRTEYLRMAAILHDWVPAMDVNFEQIDSGHLLRVVLDVQRGALFYFRVDARRHLVGVTLDQSAVLKADTAMVRLDKEVQVLLGHRPESDLNE